MTIVFVSILLGVHVSSQWLQASEGEACITEEKLKEGSVYPTGKDEAF